jgi:outer membrane protein Pom
MRRSFVLAALLAACIASGARAQTVEVPRTYNIPVPPGGVPTAQVPAPYAIPLPPSTEPNWELGARYWWSEGKTGFSINSSKINPAFGNPTSKLSYEGMQGNSAELFFRATNGGNIFAKGFAGGGWLDGGSLDDEDFFAGQIKFSDTFSKIKGDSLGYVTIDLGYDFKLIDGASKLTIGPYAGFNYWGESQVAFGARCNRDDVGGAICGPPGFVEVPFSTKVIRNEPNWASLRLGAEVRARLWDRLSLIGDFAALPVAYVWNEDSHYLRKDIGTIPNAVDRGTGWGYQLEGEARYDITPNWEIGAGVRYWFADTTHGNSEFVHFNTKVELDDFSSQRFGVFGDVTWRFSTF